MDEQKLPGGRTFGAVRIGDTVHRAVQPWTPAVHALLAHLAAQGLDGVPTVHGFDGSGREVLGYLDGETVGEALPWPAWVFTEQALRQVGGWLRRLHDATADFVPPEGAVWFAGQQWHPGLIIGHHDAAPYNAVWRDDSLVGFVDWETAGPSSREFDLSFTALSWVPLHSRRLATQAGFTDFDGRDRRFHLLLDAYGYDGDRNGFGATIPARARVNADAIRRLAATGDPTFVAMLPMADNFERAAIKVEALPSSFWTPPAD